MLNKKALAASLSAKETDADFKQTVLLLHGDGTNGAQNGKSGPGSAGDGSFLDSSTNNFTITRNGNTTQGTFSPFSQTGWSNYFDGTSNGSLRADSTTDTDLSGDFTLQAWVFPTANGQSSNSEIISRGASGSTNGWRLGLKSGGTKVFYAVNYAGTGSSVWAESTTSLTLNTWSHIAATRSGNTVTIYINGVSDATNTSFTTAPTVSGTEYVYVGRGSYDTTNRQFTGYISNASIIKGTALTTFNTTSALSASATNQSLLTCTSNRFIDTNTTATAKTLTVGSGASVQAFSPFAPTDAYSAATNGGSGYFDGTGDYLSVADNTALTLTGDHTIEAFVYLTAYNANYSTVVARWQASVTEEEFLLWIGSTGTVDFYFRPFSAGTPLLSGGTVSRNSWTHIAVVRSGNDWALFVNGSRVATASNSSSYSNTAAILTIGSILPTYSDYNLTGYISNVRLVKGTAVYTQSSTTLTIPTAPLTNITNTSLLCNFTNAGIIDQTAKNVLETVGNAQIDTGTKKFGTGSLEFDGTGDYLKIPKSPNLVFGTGDFTIECWIYVSSNPAQYTNIVSNWEGSDPAWILNFSNASGNIRFNDNGNVYLTSSSALTTGQWNHVAVSRSGTSLKMFFNGTDVASATNSTSFGSASSGVFVGAYYDNTYPLTGFIDDLRITKGKARYTANFTAPTKAFADQ